MPNYAHIIRAAYRLILDREPDPGGAAYYNGAMNAGMTEAALHEALLRSPEFAQKFPGDGPPPPPTGTLRPLGVVDGKFAAAGQPISLYGFVLCCSSDTPGVPDEAVSRGWPAIVDAPTLDLMAANKLNLAHVRLGPFSRDGETAENIAYHTTEDGRVDLTRWNDAFWVRLRTFLAAAQARGIYVQIDLIDCWVLDHQLGPWSAHRNIQGFEGGSLQVAQHAPHAIHQAWARKAVQETKAFTNVLYQDGNEAWKGGGSAPVWVSGIGDIIRSETTSDPSNPAYRLYGTNTGRVGGVDYVSFHQDVAHEPLPVPVMVNEYPTQPVEHVLAQVQLARDNGTVFFYWPGGHIWSDRERVLAGMKQIAEGGSPMPNECPWLVRMGAKVHTVMDGSFRLLEDRVPVVGGFVVFDLTPRFSHNPNDSRGLPCNGEHNVVCGGRPCEDERGGVWTHVGGPSVQMRTQEHGFQLRVGPIPAAATYTFLCSPPPNYTDQLGKAVRVVASAARECQFTVGVPA